ncbi:MAG: BrnT family toxin [Steroidobacteraceae bacterium]
MQPRPQYHFHWDDAKAQINQRTHGIAFEDAAAVFYDPLALTRYDSEHSECEDRWYTVGQLEGVVLVAVFHTIIDGETGEVTVRIISARKATPWERREYESGEYTVREPYVIPDVRIMKDEDEMPAEIDFSKGERGKFYRENAVFHFPVYLDPDVLVFFRAKAREQGIDLTPLLNQILQREMARSRVG